MFTPSDMLIKNLKSKNRYDIIGALMGYINADPSFESEEFSQAIKYALNEGISSSELFEVFDESLEFQVDENMWNQEYYQYARIYLKENFCEKRIQHVKNVAHKIYKKDSKCCEGTTGKKQIDQQKGHTGSVITKLIWAVLLVMLVVLAANITNVL